MNKTETLTLTHKEGWYEVETPDGETAFVSTIFIAGSELRGNFTGLELRVDPESWDIDDGYTPSLLIESAEWYTPPEGNDE